MSIAGIVITVAFKADEIKITLAARGADGEAVPMADLAAAASAIAREWVSSAVCEGSSTALERLKRFEPTSVEII